MLEATQYSCSDIGSLLSRDPNGFLSGGLAPQDLNVLFGTTQKVSQEFTNGRIGGAVDRWRVYTKFEATSVQSDDFRFGGLRLNVDLHQNSVASLFDERHYS